ncbi:caspase family protein [bacterium]|nr:caspase family protein [bacterium]
MMIKIIKSLLILLFLTSFSLQAHSETSWITKKSDKSKTEIKLEKKEKKAELKKKSEWIKKKKKKNKEEFKKEDKKITKEVKSWITKKNKKDKYINSLENLPESNVYFAAKSDEGKLFYGYVNADLESKKIENYYETSLGKGYFNDGKTICQIASTVREVFEGEVEGRVAGDCSDGTKFRGTFSQNMNSGYGSAKSNKGEKFEFDFNSDIKIASKIIEVFNQKKPSQSLLATAPKTNIEVNPVGKYYALLIGNAKYDNWTSLSSPVNDINEIHKILKAKYKFDKVVKIPNATRSEIFKSLKNMRDLVTDNDYLLIYYAGHGEQDTQRAYWIPVDVDKEWDPEWIDTVTITAAIQRISARHILLMIDSCYLGSSFKGNKSDIIKTESDWNAVEANKGLKNRAGLVLASGGETPVVDTVIDNKHSLFAYKFIDILKKNEDYVTSSNIFLKIKKYHSKQTQTPQFYGVENWGHLDGDFVFKVKK